jgi:hypothetical protein
VNLRRAFIPVVLVAAATLASCGGDSDSGTTDDDRPSASDSVSQTPSPSATGSESQTGDVAACDLLSTDEVEAAVGAPVKEGIANAGQPITGGIFTSCLWMSDDPDNPADQGQLYIYSNTAAADSAREDDSEEVPGIGDSAFTVSFAGVWVTKGEKSFLAQWYALSGTDDENLPKSEALAKVAADKL